jgi:hypothetical protein
MRQSHYCKRIHSHFARYLMGPEPNITVAFYV